MFEKDQFIQDCIKAIPDGQQAIREIITEAVSDGSKVIAQLESQRGQGLIC